jgi:hypothetical protein
MTPEERRAILGDAAIEDARAQARRAIAAAPPTPELLARLRLIFANPGGRPITAAEAADVAA